MLWIVFALLDDPEGDRVPAALIRDVSPPSAIANIPRLPIGDAVVRSQIAESAPRPPYDAHDPLGDYGIEMAVAATAAILSDHISEIFLLRPKKQVARVHAKLYVAFVEHLDSVRDGTTVDRPRNAVGQPWPIYVAELPVARVVLHALPNPAARCCIHFHAGEESDFGGRLRVGIASAFAQ